MPPGHPAARSRRAAHRRERRPRPGQEPRAHRPEPVNMRVATGRNSMTRSRAESAIGCPDNEIMQSSRRSSRPSSFDGICQATHEYALRATPAIRQNRMRRRGCAGLAGGGAGLREVDARCIAGRWRSVAWLAGCGRVGSAGHAVRLRFARAAWRASGPPAGTGGAPSRRLRLWAGGRGAWCDRAGRFCCAGLGQEPWQGRGKWPLRPDF